MKKITLLILLITSSVSFGQNLATKGDFEGTSPFTNTGSTLPEAYVDDGYWRRSGNQGVAEETGAANIRGSRGAKMVANAATNTQMRYGIYGILTEDIKYTVKLDILGTADGTGKNLSATWKEGGNTDVAAIGAGYKPTLSWHTWSGLLDYTSVNHTETEQYIHFNLKTSASPDSYLDNLQILILACIEETIDVEAGATSTISIYAADVNNGNSVVGLSNESLTSHTFYEADGTTNADAKFTLEADGTITADGGVAEADYKITYKLTSNSDADASGTNDWDEITQTFSVAGAPTYLPEITDFTFETPTDSEGWVGNAEVESVVVGPAAGETGAITITFPNTLAADGEKAEVLQSTNSVNPQENDYLFIRYKNNSYNDTFKFQITNNEDNDAKFVRDTVSVEGPFKTMTTGFEVLQINLSENDNWALAANARNLLMQFRDEAYQADNGIPKDVTTPGTIVIDRILFTNDASAVLSTENIEIEDINLTLSPNPVHNILTIRSTSSIEKVEIYNLLGQKVLTDNSNNIDVSSLSKGIYVSKVYLENESISSKKFIKL